MGGRAPRSHSPGTPSPTVAGAPSANPPPSDGSRGGTWAAGQEGARQAGAAVRAWAGSSRLVVGDAVRAGFIQVVLVTVLVRGLAVLAQLAIARLLNPANFGVVRSVEVVISIALIVGGCGMPTLAIKAIAEADSEERPGVLGRLLQLSLATAVAVAGLCTWAAAVLVPAPAAPYLRALIWVLPFSVVARTGLNYFQGVQRFKQMAALGAILSSVSLPCIYFATTRWRLPGWVGGRFAGEILFAIAIVAVIGREMRWPRRLPAAFGAKRLARMGFGISLSLLIRTSFDGAAVLMLGWLLHDTGAVGQYGLASLVVGGVLVLPGALANMYLPQLASQTSVEGKRYATYRQVSRVVGGAMLGIGTAVAVGAPLLPLLFGVSYQPAVYALQVLCVLLPCRALAATAGTYLLTIEDIPWMVRANAFELALALAGYELTIPRYGMAGAAWTTVTAEVVLTGFYLWRCRARSCGAREALA